MRIRYNLIQKVHLKIFWQNETSVSQVIKNVPKKYSIPAENFSFKVALKKY